LNHRPSGYEPDELPLLHRASRVAQCTQEWPPVKHGDHRGAHGIFCAMNSVEPLSAEQKRIVMYSTNWCPYCIRAKHLFNKKGYAFEEINVQGDGEKRAWLVEETGRRTVPQIFIDGVSVVGFDEVNALDRRGELDRLVRG
jgi:glutaredoxin 3